MVFISDLDLSGNNGIKNLSKLCGRVYTLRVRNCGITDVSELEGEWEWLDLSGNKGLKGTVVTKNLSVEDCGLDETFDYLGNTELSYLFIKGNDISLDHILKTTKCGYISCDPVEVEDLKNRYFDESLSA